MKKEHIAVPGKKQVPCSTRARLRGSGRATAGRGASERPFLLPSCQARLPAAVKYHHGLLSGPPMSRRGPRGREGPNELWRFGWGSCSITEPAYDGSMNRNSLEADQNLPPAPAPTQVHEAKLYIARTVVSFQKTAEVQATFCQ